MIAATAIDPRAEARRDFAAANGLAAWREVLLAGDASFRKYWRLSEGARTLVIMDAPPPQEDVRPWVRVAEHLAGLGLSVPQIHAIDAARGFLLIEDFGDETYARALARSLPRSSGGDEVGLYALAADALATLHAAGESALMPDLTHYLGPRMAELAAVLVDWYLPAAIGRAALPDERASYLAAWSSVLPTLESLPHTLVLRDFHIDNLMWLPQRGGVRACGLLDFQTAEIGSPAYDLASLVEDARRDVPDEVRTATLQHYRECRPEARNDAFDAALAICAAQRHSRIIGQFVRLKLRDGRPQYVRHLSRVWFMFERALVHPALLPVRQWIDAHLPTARHRQVQP